MKNEQCKFTNFSKINKQIDKPFKGLGLVIYFFKDLSYAHQGCIYLIKNVVIMIYFNMV